MSPNMLLLALVVGHLVADFTLETKDMVRMQSSRQISVRRRGFVWHGVIYALLNVAILSFFLWDLMFLVALGVVLLTGLHIFLDYLVVYLRTRFSLSKYNLWLFFGRQSVHLITLFLVTVMVTPGCRQVMVPIYSYSLTERVLLAVALGLIGLWGVGVFVRLYVENMKYWRRKRYPANGGEESSQLQDGGFLIGLLERAIVILAVATNMITLIGFLITVKSIVRFKKFDDDSFVEYFIIGSFISIFSAVLIGFLIRQLNVIPLLN